MAQENTVLNSEELQSGTPTPSFLSNVRIEKKLKDGTIVSYQLFSQQNAGAGNNVLIELKINQSMFNPFINGYIELYDKGDWTGEVNLTGFEDIIIKFTKDNNLEYRFKIYEAKPINDFVKSPRVNQIEKAVLYRLEFISEEVLNTAFTENILKSNKDFIGFISVKPDSTNRIKGLINEIFEKFNYPLYEIEETKNGIWLRAEEISLPTGFDRKQLNIVQLLNFLSNHAVSTENPYAVNFFCWRDLNGWHFKSIEKILKEQKEKPESELPVYILNTDDLKEERKVRSVRVDEQYNVMQLMQSSALFGYYKRVEPDYTNPYSDFLDDARGMTYQYIDYDYHRDFNKVLHIEDYKLVSDTFSTVTNENKIYKPIYKQEDIVFSFYGSEKYHRPFNEWSQHSADRGFGVKPENSATIWWNYLGRTADSRWSNITYQPNFNITSLDISKFYDIYHKIRLPLIEARQEFARKKNIKRMWEVYRCAVCCMGNASFGGTADYKLLEELKGLTSGITYNILYGATGIFADMQQEYRVVAAGSFTDAINYDIRGMSYENGLTFSYDLTKEPYNQTIGEFYNLKREIPNYIKYAIGDSLKLYDEMIDFLDKKIEEIQSFVTNAEGYIGSLNSWYEEIEVDSYQDLIKTSDWQNQEDSVEPEYPNKNNTYWQWPIGTNHKINEFILSSTKVSSDENGSLVIIPYEIVNPNDNQWNFITKNVSFATPYISRGNIIRSKVSNRIENDEFQLKTSVAALTIGASIPKFGLTHNGYPFYQLPVPLSSGFTKISLPYFDLPDYFILPNFENGLEHKWIPAGDEPNQVPVGENNYVLKENQDLKQVPNFIKNCSKEKYMLGYRKFVYNRSIYDLLHNEWGTPIESSKFTDSKEGNTNIGLFSNYETSGRFLYGPGIDVARYSSVLSPSKNYYADVFYLSDTDNIGNNPNNLMIMNKEYWTDYPWSTPKELKIEYNQKWDQLMDCVDEGNCFNHYCFNPVLVEIAKRLGEQELEIITYQRNVYNYLKETIEQSYVEKWQELYDEWWNRKAFFVSKELGTSIFTGVSGGRATRLEQDLSLFNVKKITRKEIKGSRYEILAKSNLGITGASAGEWLYNIYFGNDESNNPNDYSVNGSAWWDQEEVYIHPYYNQKYDTRNGKSAFVTKRKLLKYYRSTATDPLNDGPWLSDRVTSLAESQSKEKQYVIATKNEVKNLPGQENETPNPLIWSDLGYAQTHLNYYPEEIDELSYVYAYNIFDEEIENKKPPNIKKEEIASYVRIEFINPIGLDRIADFPNGFVRDPGSEYFLPYLVQVTPGPTGRQTIRNNVAVIGMDPYGFDVAVKKNKIERKNVSREYSWWNKYSPVFGRSDLTDSGMDLWPEQGFNVEFPYYTTDIESMTPEVKNGNFYDINFYSGEKYSVKRNPGFHAKEVDSEYNETAMGSGYLLASHKKFKPHRSWWSFYFPRNLFLYQKLEPAISTFFNTRQMNYGVQSYNNEDADARESQYPTLMTPPYRTQILTDSTFSRRNEIQDNEYDSEYTLGKENQDSKWVKHLDNQGLNSKLLKNKNEDTDYPAENINPHTDDSLEQEVRQFFKDDILHWLNADYALYRPGLVTSDVWKYDLSGETEYGIITPPIEDVNYDLFDQNFAAQFVVFARSNGNICSEYTCANPEGLVDSSSCPPENPYCNCPAQDQIPTETEPTYLELYHLYNKLKECELIEENLGKEYLGCIWSDPNNPCSCNCPEIGEKFGEYLAYTRTYSSFWSTPAYVPLFRTALLQQLTSQQIVIVISANNPRLNIGDLIYLKHENPKTEELYINQTKNLDGKWMITGITHKFIKETVQLVEITLNRDTLSKPPDIGNNAKTAYLMS